MSTSVEYKNVLAPINDIGLTPLKFNAYIGPDLSNCLQIQSTNAHANGTVTFQNITSDPRIVLSNRAWVHVKYNIKFTGSVHGNISTLLNDGYDAPRSLPFHRSCTSVDTIINGHAHNTLINSVLDPQLRYMDKSKLDYIGADGYSFLDMGNYKDLDGTLLSPFNNYGTVPAFNSSPRGNIFKLNIINNTGAAAEIEFETIEPLFMTPPFSFSKLPEPLWNIQSFNVIFHMNSDFNIWSHLIKDNTNYSDISSISSSITNAKLYLLTNTVENMPYDLPPLYLPYVENNQIHTSPQTVASGAQTTFSFANYQIGTLFTSAYIWAETVKTGSAADVVQADIAHAITGLKIQYANQTMFNNYSPEQLYTEICKPVGLNYGQEMFDGNVVAFNGSKSRLAGSYIKLIPGINFNLGEKSIGGVSQNRDIQIDVTVKNTDSASASIVVHCVFFNEGLLTITRSGCDYNMNIMTLEQAKQHGVSHMSKDIEDIITGGDWKSFWSKVKTGFNKVNNYLKDKKLVSKVAKSLGSVGVPYASTVGQYAEKLGYGYRGGIPAGGFNGGAFVDESDLYDE